MAGNHLWYSIVLCKADSSCCLSSDMSSSRGDGTFGGFTTNSLRSPNEDPPMSEVSSLTSASLCSTWEAQHLQVGTIDPQRCSRPKSSQSPALCALSRPCSPTKWTIDKLNTGNSYRLNSFLDLQNPLSQRRHSMKKYMVFTLSVTLPEKRVLCLVNRMASQTQP